MSIVDALVAVALREWTRWGGPIVRVDGSQLGFADANMEAMSPYWTYVGQYWHAIGSSLDGRDPPAWSAAFISYCFSEAAAGGRFPADQNHSAYVSKIESGAFPGLSLEDPAATPLAVGDLVWAARTGDDCRAPPLTFADAKAEVAKIRKKKAGTFCSHTDIVVAVRSGEVDVIGGNVKQAVTRTTYRLDTHGRISDGRRAFIGVIRNAL
jgi:hypothetical protein